MYLQTAIAQCASGTVKQPTNHQNIEPLQLVFRLGEPGKSALMNETETKYFLEKKLSKSSIMQSTERATLC